VSNRCRGKLHCSICSGEHKYSERSAAAPICPNCGGSHSANEKIYPRYQRETEILKLQLWLIYLMLMPVKSSELPEILLPPFSFAVHFPPTFKVDCGSYSCKTFFKCHSVSAWYRYPTGSGRAHRNGTNDFSSLLFGNPITFLASLAEVIKQTNRTRYKNENIDLCQIITEAAGGPTCGCREVKTLE